MSIDHLVFKHQHFDFYFGEMGASSHFGERREKGVGGRASAEEGEVALPAAHLAAHVGQYVVNIPSGQLRDRDVAQALQTALIPGGHTWNNNTQLMLKKTLI